MENSQTVLRYCVKLILNVFRSLLFWLNTLSLGSIRLRLDLLPPPPPQIVYRPQSLELLIQHWIMDGRLVCLIVSEFVVQFVS